MGKDIWESSPVFVIFRAFGYLVLLSSVVSMDLAKNAIRNRQWAGSVVPVVQH